MSLEAAPPDSHTFPDAASMVESTSTPRKPAVWPLVAMPFVIVASVVGGVAAGGVLSDLSDLALPFMVTTWIGMGFTFAWESVRFSMVQENFSPGMMAAVGLLAGGIFLMELGPETLWQDPWIFGVAVWPGFAMARPWLKRQIEARRSPAAGQAASTGDDLPTAEPPG